MTNKIKTTCPKCNIVFDIPKESLAASIKRIKCKNIFFKHPEPKTDKLCNKKVVSLLQFIKAYIEMNSIFIERQQESHKNYWSAANLAVTPCQAGS